MAMRNVGSMGQDEFGKLCSSAGLTRNQSREDMTGWDYLVEFPLPRVSGQPADMAPPALQCRVQVKATDKHRRKWDISLANLERLAKSPIPAFICLIEFNGEENAKNVYLVHIGEVIIRRVLKRLRELEKVPSRDMKRSKLSVVFAESDRLSEPNGPYLRRAIESPIAEGYDKYCRWKLHLLSTVGYENGFGRIDATISTLPDSDPIDVLLDVSLGLRKSVKVTKWSEYDTRFGIAYLMPSPMVEDGELSITSGSLNATVSFRERKSSPSIDFSVKLHNSSVNQLIPRERIKLRLKAQFFDVILEPFKGAAQFKLLLDNAKTSAKLADLRDVLKLLHMFSVSGPKGIRMELIVDNRTLSEGKLTVHQFAVNPEKELAIVEQALTIARVYNVEQRVSTTISELMVLRRPISVFYNMGENPAEHLTMTFTVNNPIQATDNAGLILLACVPLGSYSLYSVFGLVGRVEQISEKEYRLVSREKSFHKRVLKEKGGEIDDTELADLITNTAQEMENAGVCPVVAIREWWGTGFGGQPSKCKISGEPR